MATFNQFYGVPTPSQTPYRQGPLRVQSPLKMTFQTQNLQFTFSPLPHQLPPKGFYNFDVQEPNPVKKVKTGPYEQMRTARMENPFQSSNPMEQKLAMLQQNQAFIQYEKLTSDTTDSSYNINPLEPFLKEMEASTTEDLEIPPVLDQDSILPEIQKNRADYAAFFDKMQDKLMTAFKKQLEFLSLLKDLNRPEYAMRCPVLDKINPLIAGVLSKKSKIDENSITVMKRTHRLLKSGPAVRSTVPKYKTDFSRNQVRRPNGYPMRSEKVLQEFEVPFTSNLARKMAQEAQVKENERTCEQLMSFILQGCEKTEKESKIEEKLEN